MTAQSKTVIKSYFQTGDKPTQAQFVDFIDSYQDFGSTIASYYPDTGVANAYVITPAPAIISYTAGLYYFIKIANANTGGTTTLNVNGIGAVNMTYMDGTALSSGALPANCIAQFIYDGTKFQLINILPTTGGAAINALTGDVTASGSGSVAATISNNAVTTSKIADNNITLAKIATQAADTVLANATNGSASPTAIALSPSNLFGKGSTGNIAPITLGAGLSISGTVLSSTAGSAVVSIKRQIFTSSGTYTPSTGMLYCDVEVLGSGAGGQGAASGGFGAGGGGGAYSRSILSAATIGVSQTVTIGAAGANNSNGSASSLGSLVTANGGQRVAAGANAAAGSVAQGGAGGSAGSGDIATGGQPGDWNPGASLGTNGASSIYGGGGLGAVTGVGGSATGYGAGGGGAQGNGTVRAGGSGTQGVIAIFEYCSV